MDETASLLPNAQHTQQRLDDHSLQNFPEVAGENRTIGPRLLASLVIDSIQLMPISHFVLYFTEFYPDSVDRDYRPSGPRRTFCGGIFDDVGLRYWRVATLFLFCENDPTSCRLVHCTGRGISP